VYRLHLCLCQALSGSTLISHKEHLEIGAQRGHESNAHYSENSQRYQHFCKGHTRFMPFEFKPIHEQPSQFASYNTNSKYNQAISSSPATVLFFKSIMTVFRLTTLLF
jgi:hypothetical protein